MTVSAVRPWRTALQRERSFPSGVVGPVLLSALRRLASICLSELIEDQLAELALFCRFGAVQASRHLQARILRRVCSQSSLAISSGLILRFSHQAHFIAGLMQLPVMTAAEGYGELVADFEAEGSGLGKPQVMRIGRLTAADETRLRGDKPQMSFVTKPLGFGNGENALVDLAGTRSGEARDNIEVSTDGRTSSSRRP